MDPQRRITKLAKVILGKLSPSRYQLHSDLSTIITRRPSSRSTSSRSSSPDEPSRLDQTAVRQCLLVSRSPNAGHNGAYNGKITTEYKPAFETISLQNVDIDKACLDLVNSESFQKAATSQLPREIDDIAALTRDTYASVPPIFSSVCVCDDIMAGLPVYLRSKHFAYGPRSLRIGRAIFANLTRAEREECGCCSISARGPSRAGSHERPRFFLEYHATLFSVARGGPKSDMYVLSSTINITPTITSLVERCLTAEVLYGSLIGQQSAGAALCARRCQYDIDWIISAQDELQGSHRDPLQNTDRRRDDRPARTELSFLENDVSFQIQKLSWAFRLLHRDYFSLLRCQGSWEIYSASYSLAFDGMRLRAGFSAPTPLAQQKLIAQLKNPQPFSTSIKWNMDGMFKTLYCQPMYRKEFHSWMCFMVDAGLPDLWAGSRWART